MELATHRCIAALAVSGLLGLWSAAACTPAIEYPQEGRGQPTPRAAGTLPPGSVGVCKVPFTKRPPIVSDTLWEHARSCSPRTPGSYIRLGYAKAGSAGTDPEAEQLVERVLGALTGGTKVDGGNNQFTSALRAVRGYAAKRDDLRSRIVRESPTDQACDFTYLLNTMQTARGRLSPDDPCTAKVFDPVTRTDECLFDMKRAEAAWVTSGWDCMTFTGALGVDTSCYRLCGYDDFCARQVYCAAGELDLMLCTMGVCLPEPRTGVY